MSDCAVGPVTYVFTMILWINGAAGPYPSTINGYDSLHACRRAIPDVSNSFLQLSRKNPRAAPAADLLALDCIETRK